jgi:cysteinyl-tRNA synthetase
MSNQIQLYNTKSRQIELFKPITEGYVNMYSCGPTVYHYAHLGNLREYVTTDIVRRMFAYAGYTVNAVINITDVGHTVDDDENAEDKMEKGSKREGKSAYQIAKEYTEAYFNDLDSLNIDRSAYQFPRATETIQEQIDLIVTLEKKGYTYTTHDGIYFDTSKFPQYSLLARLDVKGLKSGARVEENTEKRNVTDFALWKFSPKNEQRQMEWESPWGVGFPGWHIECSAMSKKLLGSHFDIHMGGIDHIPVHHTNEIAQSECANEETYVNYWLHYNFLNDPTGKMSKSKGDFLRLQSVVDKGINPLAYRYYLLTIHYRKEIEFSFEALFGAAQAFDKLMSFARAHYGSSGKINETYCTIMTNELYSDVGTPGVIASIWNMMKDATVPDEDKYITLLEIDKVLGLKLGDQAQVQVEVTQEVQILLEKRKDARDRKAFEEADTIRRAIFELGYVVTDTQNGQEITKR